MRHNPHAGNGHAAHTINLSFSQSANPRWTYDPRTKNWLRSEGSTPSRLTSGGQINARTIIVLRVTTRDAGYRDPAGNFVPRTVFVGWGRASVFTEGKEVDVLWTKASPSAPLQLVTRAGKKQVYVAPGRTWIEMLTTSGSMRVS